MNLPKILPRALVACLALALGGFLAISAIAMFPRQNGVDFYHFWGIDIARETGQLKGTPYRDSASYANVLNTLVDASPSAKLHRANATWRELAPTGTPFLYAAFSFLPSDYEVAHAMFVAFMYAAGLAGTFVLVRLRGFDPSISACLALFTAITFGPFILDIFVSNVNLLQLAAYAFLLYLALRPPGQHHAIVEATAQSLAWVLVAFKPNTAFMSAAYELQRLIAIGRTSFSAAAGIALVALIAALLAGALYFGTFMAWPDWWSTARHLGSVGAVSDVSKGNLSIAMWLAVRTGAHDPATWGVLLGAILVAAVFAAARSPGASADETRRVLRHAFADPFYAMSFAVLFTFAFSPLVWKHYLVMALVPIAWQLRGEGRIATIGAIVTFFVMSRQADQLAYSLGGRELLDLLGRVSWLALVPGLLVSTRRRS